MNKVQKALAFLAAAAVVTSTVLLQPASAVASEEKKTYESARQQLLQQQNVVFVEGSVTVNDMNREDLYSYVTNLENDPAWYPGTLSSELISGNGGAGTKYREFVNFGTGNVEVIATVLGAKPTKYFWFTSDGILNNVTQYAFKKVGQDKAKLTISSVVLLPEGFTEEALTQYLGATLQQLLNALGKTGEIEIH